METPRLRLRPLRQSDAQAIFDGWTQDARVAQYCRWHPHTSIEMTQNWLAACMDSTTPYYPYRFVITLKDSDEPIGCIDVVEISDDRTTAEIGYVLAYSHWNKGYMTEVLEVMIAHLFTSGFKTIVARHHIDNHASGKVMEKCGMHYVGTEETQEKFGSDKTVQVKRYAISQQ